MADLVSIARTQTDSREFNQFQNSMISGVVPPLNRLLANADRANCWTALGVWVGAAAPTTPTTYAAWLSTGQGFWAWITP